MKRTPLRRKRAAPRRNEGRVQHERIKPRAGQGPTTDQLRYWDELRLFPDGRARPCQCACGKQGEAIHHILARAPGKGGRRDHWFVVLLAHECHNLRGDSVHGLGGEAAYEREHGIDLVQVAIDNLARYRSSSP